MQYDYLLVHGAFSNAAVWQRLVPQLEAAGARVATLDLPGHTAADTATAGRVTMDDYVARVVRELDAAPAPVILVGHSMGGLIISGAAEARPDKVAALAYLCAILPESGTSLLDYGGTDTQSKLGPHLQVSPDEGVARFPDDGKREVLCNRSDAAATAIALGYTFPQPLQPFGTGVALTDANFGRVKRFYVATTDDNAIGYDLQMRMVAARPCERVFTIDTDHMVQLSATAAVAKDLLEIRAALA